MTRAINRRDHILGYFASEPLAQVEETQRTIAVLLKARAMAANGQPKAKRRRKPKALKALEAKIAATPELKKRGRKPKAVGFSDAELQAMGGTVATPSAVEPVQAKRRGRPAGSKNKPKVRVIPEPTSPAAEFDEAGAQG